MKTGFFSLLPFAALLTAVIAAPTLGHAQTAVVTPLYSFSGSDGNEPYSPLVVTSGGLIYGVTYTGGLYNNGRVFELAIDGTGFTPVYDFGTATNDAAGPVAGLIDGGDGYFYGTSEVGGSINAGAIYKVSPTGAYLTLHSFTNADSLHPEAPLLKGSDGLFYCTTSSTYACTNLTGVYRFDSDGNNFTLLTDVTDGTNAAAPVGPLVEVGGYFYGVTETGGANGDGTVFRFNATGASYPLASFSATTGYYPSDGLVDGGDGYLYGPAYYGGTNNSDGTIYKVKADGGVFTALYSFSTASIGFSPSTKLLLASDGNFYGQTLNGGTDGSGIIFQLTPAGVETTLLVCNQAVIGAGPSGALVEDPNSPLTFYGVNTRGGANGDGVIFKMVVTPRPAAPVVTSATAATGTKGAPFTYQITATNSPTSYGASPLPGGLVIDTASGEITGSPTFAGTTNITLSATNAGGTGSATLTLTVASTPNLTPVITSAVSAPAQVGVAFTYQITATNSPTSYGASSLPNGLSLDGTTGLISGTPTVTGTFTVPLSATNAVGTGTASLTLTVATPIQPTVAITSPPPDATLVVGGTLPLAASVTNPAGLAASVQFLIDGAPLNGALTAAPFVTSATLTTAGTFTLSAVATDSLGRTSTSSQSLTVAAANASIPAPSAALLTPLANRNLLAGTSLTLTFAAASAPTTTLQAVSLYADGTLVAAFDGQGNPLSSVASAGGSPTRRDAPGASAGPSGTIFQTPYQLPGYDTLVNLVAVALDAAGQTTVSDVATVHATVSSDVPPQAVLGGLASGAAVAVGSSSALTVSATAGTASAASTTSARRIKAARAQPHRTADATSALVQLEYVLGQIAQTLGAAPPYTVNFAPATAGKYVLHAVATDASGLATISAPVVVEADEAVVTAVVAGDGYAVEGGENGKVFIYRTGNTTAPLTVNYKVQGSAHSGVDYQPVTGVATIPAGATRVKIKIKPIDQPTVDGTRVAKVKLKASASGLYTLGNPAVAKIKIIDNE